MFFINVSVSSCSFFLYLVAGATFWLLLRNPITGLVLPKLLVTDPPRLASVLVNEDDDLLVVMVLAG